MAISANDVLNYLQIKNVTLPITEAELEPIVWAINSKVIEWHGYAPSDRWTDNHRLGAIMLAARISRRKLTPGGIPELGELNIGAFARSDPDASMLLGLGAWTKPMVG